VFRQSGKASNGGGGPGNVVLPAAPNNGNLLVCLAAANGAGISSITQTNVTWTQRRHDNVAAVGALDLWTGVVGAGASATATVSGMSGAASATISEVVSGTCSGLGASSIYGSSLSNKIGGPLSGITVGHLIAFIVNTAGSGPNGPCMLSCPCSWSWEAGSNQFALGVATGQDVMAYYPGGGTFSLIEIVP
jgi:hypothetical protein